MYFFFFYFDGIFNIGFWVYVDKICLSGSVLCFIEVIVCLINIDYRFNCKVVLVKIFICVIIGKIIVYCFEILKVDM